MCRWPSRIRDAGGSRTHLNRVAAGCLAVWLQRLSLCAATIFRRSHATQMSSPGVEPGLRPSHGRVLIPAHSEDVSLTVPRRRIERRLADPKTAVLSGTLAGHVLKYPNLESNQDLDLRRVRCDPLHHRDVQPEPTTGFAPALSGLQDRRLAIRPRRLS